MNVLFKDAFLLPDFEVNVLPVTVCGLSLEELNCPGVENTFILKGTLCNIEDYIVTSNR